MTFSPNMGRLHRIIYVTLGVALIAAAAFAPQLEGRTAWIAAALGAGALASGGVGF